MKTQECDSFVSLCAPYRSHTLFGTPAILSEKNVLIIDNWLLFNSGCVL